MSNAKTLIPAAYPELEREAYLALERDEALASMTAAYRGESLSGEFDDDGSPEHDD